MFNEFDKIRIQIKINQILNAVIFQLVLILFCDFLHDLCFRSARVGSLNQLINTSADQHIS